MSKLRLYHLYLIIGCIHFSLSPAHAQFSLRIIPVDKDSSFIKTLKLQTNFRTQDELGRYVENLPVQMQGKGYATASIDSISYTTDTTTIHLFSGEPFQWARLSTSGIEKKVLALVAWDDEHFLNKPLNLDQYQAIQEKILSYYENNGYPFAKVYIDSISLTGENEMSGILKAEIGPKYKIDSIRIYGNARISNQFLQQYLDLPNGGFYQKEKLQKISARIRELPYLQEQQPWTLSMLGTGSVLNLHLQQKKSSQVNVLVGLLPSNEQSGKLLVTGEANINLKNAIGNGESIGLNWQQFLPKSPRLNISFQQPYLFKTLFGINTSFDLYKKDSSYVNVNMILGIQYNATSFQTASIYLQNQKTNVLNLDTVQVLITRKLPDVADISSVNFGVSYNFVKTDYRFNPTKGNELLIHATAGTRNVKKSPAILKLRNPSDPSFQYESLYDSIKAKSYQFRVRMTAAHYFPLTRVSTFKTGVELGWFQSPGIFRNELFQIGGYKLLRGFDEESIFVSSFVVLTGEYRYLIGTNSFLFSFIDLGLSGNKQNSTSTKNNYLGAGLGLAFETKAGIFNISYAAGKRNDVKFDLRQSKIHLGFVTLF